MEMATIATERRRQKAGVKPEAPSARSLMVDMERMRPADDFPRLTSMLWVSFLALTLLVGVIGKAAAVHQKLRYIFTSAKEDV